MLLIQKKIIPYFFFQTFMQQINKMRKEGFIFFVRLIPFIFFNILFFSTRAQDSSHLRISLLTCTPGQELYSTFGHSALRIIDSSSVTDIVFNYGTFNFDDEGFYLKFVRGKLMYYLSIENFKDFKEAYMSENRGITEQVLLLSAKEKLQLQEAMLLNLKENNRFYKYDFFLDNCTTRLRDMILRHKEKSLVLPAVTMPTTKFRTAIHTYLDKNENHWSKLGIDFLLGLPTDAVMTTSQSQFLPDVLMKAMDSSNSQQYWVAPPLHLYPLKKEDTTTVFFTPLVIFSLLTLAIFAISFFANKWVAIFLQGFDGLLFFLTGIGGIILILMWIATDHAMCKNNFNLLWALPTNIILAFHVSKRKGRIKKYFGITALLLTLILCSWFFLPQQMNNAFIPLVLLMIIRTGRKYFS